MSRRILRFVLRLYPRPWRDAHGPELEQLTEDLLDDPGERPWRVAASTALGALREQVRPKYLTAGRLVGLGAVGVTVVVVAGLGAFLGSTPGPVGIPASALAPARIPSPSQLAAILRRDHVRVTLNGTDLSLLGIAGETFGFDGSTATQVSSAVREGSVVIPTVRYSPTVGLKKAISYVVLTELIMQHARRTDRVVSVSTARAYAEHVYAEWRSDPVPLRGATGAQAFLSAGAVAGYRQTLTMERELTSIAGSDDDGRTPALRKWMSKQLGTNRLVIQGVPGLDAGNVAASLPSEL